MPPCLIRLNLQLLGSGDDAQELVGLQAGPADQRPVDVGLGEQLGGVVRLDAAAVLDADRLGNCGIVALGP